MADFTNRPNIKVQLVIELVYSNMSCTQSCLTLFQPLRKSGDWTVDWAVMLVGARPLVLDAQ